MALVRHQIQPLKERRLYSVFYLLCMLPYGTFAQKKEEATYTYKPFQISVFPGMGTNGINAGRFKNGVSLNLVAGYSAANNTFEIGGLSNFNQYFSSGIQIAGIKNTIGGDR